MTGHAFAMAMAALIVNGPQDDRLDWDAIIWRTVEADVRRLRQRIFKATQDEDWPKVRNLQKMTAPRGALSYPRYSREELEGRFLGLMAYLDPKR
jgi:N-terminal domain of reverse transcriptase